MDNPVGHRWQLPVEPAQWTTSAKPVAASRGCCPWPLGRLPSPHLPRPTDPPMALELFLCEVCKLKLECQKKGHLQIMNAYNYIYNYHISRRHESILSTQYVLLMRVYYAYNQRHVVQVYVIQATIRYTVIGLYINLVCIYRQMHWQPV